MKRAPMMILFLCMIFFFAAAPLDAATNATRIILNADEIEIDVDDSFLIDFTLEPVGAEYAYVTFSSNNSWIASVSQNGRVYGNNEGTTWITVYVYNVDGSRGVSAQMRVKVEEDWWDVVLGSGGGCNVFAVGLTGLLVPLFGVLYRRRK